MTDTIINNWPYLNIKLKTQNEHINLQIINHEFIIGKKLMKKIYNKNIFINSHTSSL